MKKLFIFLLPLLFAFNACGGGSQLPPQVCEIGGIVCDVSETLCTAVPQIPPEVCLYLELACVNLEILCTTPPGSPEYETAAANISAGNKEFSLYLETLKKK